MTGDSNPVAKKPDDNKTDIFRLLTRIEKSDSNLGLVFTLTVLVLSLVVWLTTTGGLFDGGIVKNPWDITKRVLITAVCCAGFTIFFKIIDGSWIAKAVVVFVTGLAGLTLTLGWLQFVTNNKVPFVVHLSCVKVMNSEGCPLGKIREIADEDPIVVVANLENGEAVMQVTRPQPVVQSVSPVTKGASDVYIQFAGAISRDTIKTVAANLMNKSWSVQGADRGGERTSAAVGYNEVRYFHTEDEKLADQLVKDFNAALTEDQKELKLTKTVDLSGRYQVPKGQLEVFTSN